MKEVRKIIVVIYLLGFSFNGFTQDGRWSEERACRWYQDAGWLNGFNYIPSDAINYTAMWDKTSFNPLLVDKELTLAASLGFNCARVVLQYAVYADDPRRFLKNLDTFLSICQKYGIRVMPCFFDDCAFGVNTDPVAGKQPEPLKGWYAWAWSPSPGHTMVVDARYHPLLEKYVKDVMRKFKDDARILIWDLYNEPSASHLGSRSIPLVNKVFAWAREINPSQPLTIGFWNNFEELNNLLAEKVDVVSYHCYGNKNEMREKIGSLRKYNRPLICSEWMNRPASSTIADIMPLLKDENVGAMLWGLVNGKTQTDLPWGFRPEKLPYNGEWQHDLFRPDFTPYNDVEHVVIKSLNGDIPAPVPAVVPNKYQVEQIERKYGMFIHFGINTFHNEEWTAGDKPAESYKPAAIDARQWVETAKNAGMKYVILVTKHHDGFCLWDSRYTEYDVASSGNAVNVVEAVAKECKAQGIALGLYYSLWDRKQNPGVDDIAADSAYNRYMVAQLNELIDITARHTPIVELWLDGSWTKAADRWQLSDIYKTVKYREPQCQISTNWTIGYDDKTKGNINPKDQKELDPIHYFPSDFRLGDPLLPANPDPKLFTHKGKTYYMPWESTVCLSDKWFFNTADSVYKSVDELVELYNIATAQDNILILNCPPNREGRMRDRDVELLIALRKKLNTDKIK